MALGTLEPRDGIISLGSALLGHRIERVQVTEGALVNQGDVLVELDSAVDAGELQLAELQLEEARQRQQLEIETAVQRQQAARLALDQLKAGRDLELEVQQAKIAVLAAKRKQCETDLARLQQLRSLSEPLASEQQVEQQAVLVDVSRSEHAAAQVGLKKLNQSLDFQMQTSTGELEAAEHGLRLARSETGIKALEQKVALQKIKLAQVQVRAPITGTVLKVAAHAGELVSQAPLLQMADLENMVCTAEVDATDVQHLKIGQTARVYSRAFRGPYRKAHVEGKVERLGSVAAGAALQPMDPRQPVDRHVVKVVVSLDAGKVREGIFGDAAADAAAMVGLQVEVEFPRQSHRRSAPSP